MTSAGATCSWITYPKRNPQARVRLFCFPYAGGATLPYRGWADKLPTDVEICPVMIPGRGSRLTEPAFTRLLPLVRAIAEAMLSHLNRPFALFGHSMGATIAFELARYLRRSFGCVPSHLFVSGCRAPQLPRKNPPIHNLPESEFIAELRRLNGTTDEVLENSELIRLVIPTLRADFEVCSTYEYRAEAPLDCPISAYGGMQDPDVGRADLEAWSEQTTESVSVRMLPGDHFFINAPNSRLLQILPSELYRSAEGDGHDSRAPRTSYHLRD